MDSTDIHWGLGEHTLGNVGVLVPSVTGTWRRLSIVVPSTGGAVERLVVLVGINYDTG